MNSVVLQQLKQVAADVNSFSNISFLHRFTVGLLIGIVIWLIGLLVSLILNPFVENNTFGTTFLHDLPAITLIFGLVIALDIWGLLPSPEEAEKEKEKNQEIDENTVSST